VWFDLVEAPEQLTGTRVELVLREEATETPILEIAPRENDQLTGRFAELSCPFVPGEERLVIATLPPNRPGGVAAFNVTCRILSGETWTVQVRCEIPQPPMIA
jgi:hypothetical protein